MKATEFLDKLKKLTREDLVEIKGMGDVLADNFIEFLESPRYKNLYSKFSTLEKKGVEMNISETKATTGNSKINEKTICITGSFDISRNEIKDKLESLGAHVTSAISKSTDYLLAGEKAGSKLDKAKKLGVEIVNDYNDFL